jgi:hypothetical protein
MSERLPLTKIYTKAKVAYPEKASRVPGYGKAYKAILNGELPAEQGSNGHYTVHMDDFARVFGLTEPAI